MATIVGIGGGLMAELENLPIDRAIVDLTGRQRPRALFVPTASGDSPERWQVFQDVYGARIGCQTDVLWLLDRRPSRDELEAAVLSADVVYVGGGNTLKMMRRWRLLGVDDVLREAHRRGVVLAGQSAGMLCWFAWGHSDSQYYYSPDDWDYLRVRGMGLVDAIGCPHFNSETAGVPRADSFKRMVAKHPEPAIAVDNHCAIEFTNGGYRLHTARDGVGAYQLYKRRDGLVVEPLPHAAALTPTATLFDG